METSELLRVSLLAVGLAVFLFPQARLSERTRNRLLAALALAAVVTVAAADTWRFFNSPWVRVWNVYHYYIGAKYFPELGFKDLYRATLAADQEGRNYWSRIEKVRDLATHRVIDRELAVAGYRPDERFSAERWQSFKLDLQALQIQMRPERWRGIFRDRGYNPSPFWSAVGGTLARLLPATQPLALKLLCLLDLPLLAIAFLALRSAFGLRTAALTLLLFAASPVNEGRLVGGFLQYDWFAAFALGLAALRRHHTTAAAAGFAYAALARVFPVVFVAAAGVPVIWRWLRSGRLPRRPLKLLVVFALFCLVGVGLGALSGRGLGAWREFADHISFHAEEHVYGEQRIGLKHLFTHDLGSFGADESKSERRERFAAQEGLWLATAIFLLLLLTVALRRRTIGDALLLGQAAVFALLVSSRYYASYLALLPLLAMPHALARRRQRFAVAGQLAVFLVQGLYLLTRPTPYAAYTLLNLLFGIYWVVLLASFLLVRRRSLSAPGAARADPGGPRRCAGRSRFEPLSR